MTGSTQHHRCSFFSRLDGGRIGVFPFAASVIIPMIPCGDRAFATAPVSPIDCASHPAGTCDLYQVTTLSNESLVTIAASDDFLC